MDGGREGGREDFKRLVTISIYLIARDGWDKAEKVNRSRRTILQEIAIDKVRNARSFRVVIVASALTAFKIHTFASGCLCSSDRTSQSCSTLIADRGGTSKSANGPPPPSTA